MADVANTPLNAEVEEAPPVSDFMRYLENNPEMSNEIMKMVSTLYNTPMKISQV